MRTETLRSNREESVRGAAGSLDFSSSGGDVNGTREDARPGRVWDGYRTDWGRNQTFTIDKIMVCKYWKLGSRRWVFGWGRADWRGARNSPASSSYISDLFHVINYCSQSRARGFLARLGYCLHEIVSPTLAATPGFQEMEANLTKSFSALVRASEAAAHMLLDEPDQTSELAVLFLEKYMFSRTRWSSRVPLPGLPQHRMQQRQESAPLGRTGTDMFQVWFSSAVLCIFALEKGEAKIKGTTSTACFSIVGQLKHTVLKAILHTTLNSKIMRSPFGSGGLDKSRIFSVY
jgi:hypothetical protein